MKNIVLLFSFLMLACTNGNLIKSQKEQNIITIGHKTVSELNSLKVQQRNFYLGSERDVCNALFARADILKKYAISIESYVTNLNKEALTIELERDLHSLVKNIEFETYPQGRGSAFNADVAELYVKHLTNRIIYYLCKIKTSRCSYSDNEILTLLSKFGYRFTDA